MRPSLVVGLTGGIGSGKTTVADMFADLGIPIIDSDVLARELVEPGEPALAEIAAAFGNEYIDENGRLDRARLRAFVFAEPERREQLEAILHPRIRRETDSRLDAMDAPYCLLCIPLLLESGRTASVDRVLVVDVPVELQIERTQRRDGTPLETIMGILQAQVSREERHAAADDLISNDSDLEALKSQVDSLHQKFLSLSR